MIALAATCCLGTIRGSAQNFDDYFIDKTLRIDYIFAGDFNKQNIYVDELNRYQDGMARDSVSARLLWTVWDRLL